MWTNTDGMQEDLHSPRCPWELSKPPKDQQRETLHSPGNSKHRKLGIQTENIYIYIPPSSHWHSLAQWFVPKYKTSWKAITAPNGESYITLPTNSIFLPSKRMSTVPPTWSPGHLGQWLTPRYSARKQCWTIQPLSPGISEHVQTNKDNYIPFSFQNLPYDPPCSHTGDCRTTTSLSPLRIWVSVPPSAKQWETLMGETVFTGRECYAPHTYYATD